MQLKMSDWVTVWYNIPPTGQLIVSKLLDRRSIRCVSFYLAFRPSLLLDYPRVLVEILCGKVTTTKIWCDLQRGVYNTNL